MAGIKNKDHALYLATGIDNSGLIQDAEQGKKIVKNMTDAVVQEGSRMQQALSDTGKATQGLSNVRKESESLFANFKPTTESAKRMRDYLTSLGNVKITSLTEQIKEAKVAISQTESDIKKLQATFDNAAPGKAKMFALSELNAAKKALGEIKGELTVMESHMSKTSTTSQRLTSQIRLVKDEMGKMAMAGKRNTEEYENLRQKAIQLQQQLNSTNKQMKILASPMANFQGVISGITGMTGALSAGMGALGLFSQENENMARIQTKLQSVMAITIGLQQVATTLNKNSPFQLATVAKAKNVLTAATTRLSIALGISNVAAKTLMATLTFGLSLAITGLIVLWDHYSSKAKQAAEKQKLAQQQISNAINSVTGTMADQMVTLHNLIKRWDSLGDNLKRKKKFIDENKDSFHSLGITVNTVNEAENALVRNTGSVIKAMQLRAQAAAYQKIAQEEYEKMARAELQAQFAEKSAPVETDYKKAQTVNYKGGGTIGYYTDKSDTANAEANKQKRVDKLRVEARMHLVWGNHVMKSTDELNAELSKGLDKAGINEYTGSDTYKKDKDAAKKAQEEAEKLRKQTDKYKVLLSDQAVEEKQASEDLQLQVDEARMKAMDEGSKKTIAEMELNFEKEMQTIDRQKEETLRKKVNAAREIFEANPQNKGKSFNDSTVKLSDEDNKYFDELYKAALDNWDKVQKDMKQTQINSWNEYLKEFGTYLEKRKAIQDLYQDEMSRAKTEGEKASLNKQMQNELDELDNSVKNSATLMGQLFADASRKSVNEIQAIIDKAELLMRYLESIKDEEGNANIGGKTVSKKEILGLGISENSLTNLGSSTDEIESLRSAILRLKNDLGNKSPFKLFESDIKTAISTIRQGGKRNLGQGITEIGNAVVQFTPALSQFGQNLGAIFGDEGLGESIQKISDGISGLGETASGVGQIISGDIIGGVMSAVSGISKITSLFGGESEEEKRQRYIEQLNQVIAIYDKIIDKQKESIKFGYGFSSIQAAEKAMVDLNKQTDYYRKLAKESPTFLKQGIQPDYRKALEDLGVPIDILERIFGSTAQLSTLTATQLTYIRDNYKELWASLKTEQRDALQSIIDAEEKGKDIIAQWKEAITGISYDSFYDEFINTLSDMDTSAQDMASNFGEYLKKSIIAAMVAKNFQTEIDLLYDKWAYAGNKDSDGGIDITEDEAKAIQNEYNKLVERMAQMRDDMSKTYGWESDSNEKGVTGKLEAALTEGTANEVLGVINMGTLDLRMLKEMTADHFKDYATEMKYISNMLDETRQINANTRRTADNTDGLIDKLDTGFKELKSELTEIKKNTKDTSGR